MYHKIHPFKEFLYEGFSTFTGLGNCDDYLRPEHFISWSSLCMGFWRQERQKREVI